MESPTGSVTRIEPLLGPALDRVVELSQRVVTDRMELLRIESRDWMVRGALYAGLVALGTLTLTMAWFALLAAAVVALDGSMPLEERLALAAAVQALVGGSILVWAMRRGRGAR